MNAAIYTIHHNKGKVILYGNDVSSEWCGRRHIKNLQSIIYRFNFSTKQAIINIPEQQYTAQGPFNFDDYSIVFTGIWRDSDNAEIHWSLEKRHGRYIEVTEKTIIRGVVSDTFCALKYKIKYKRTNTVAQINGDEGWLKDRNGDMFHGKWVFDTHFSSKIPRFLNVDGRYYDPVTGYEDVIMKANSI